MEDETRSENGQIETMEAPAGETVDAGALTAERDQLAQDKAELQDQLLRRAAEFDNFRRRAERERMEFAEYAGMEMARMLLPTLDDFERALKAASEASDAGGEFIKGFELIYQRLLDTLQKQGLQPVEALHQPFDPHLHHAVKKDENADVEDNTVLEEYQRGYNFKGKLLRPAMVRVSVKP